MIYFASVVKVKKNMHKKGIIERKRYIDEETGEIIEVPVIVKYTDNKDFDMIFFGHLLDIIEDLGNKKIAVLKHIISNRIRQKNVFLGTLSEIAEATKVNIKTVQAVVRKLEQHNAIVRKTGRIIINPNVISDGRYKNKIMYEYKLSQINGNNKEFEEIKDYA